MARSATSSASQAAGARPRWTSIASTAASRSSPARGAASAGPTRACSPTAAPASWSTTWAARSGATGADAQPASPWWPTRSSRPAGRPSPTPRRGHRRPAPQALVDAAVEQFGRLDVLINNAGIMRWAGMPDVDEDNLARHLAVHVGGSFNTTRAAWPHMVEQGYGRIVMTTSAGMFGLPNNTSYATAKGGGHRADPQPGPGRRRARHQGQPHRAGGDDPDGRAGRARRAPTPQMSPELVAPMVAFLAHEDCPVSGEIYAAGAGRFARIFIASTPGYVHPAPEPDDRGRRRQLGRRSTTRPATTCRPTSWTGRPPSWPTCPDAE